MDKINLKQTAIDLLTKNKVSVIPVGPDKIPLIPWKEYQTRFATIDEINSWWEKYPDAQIGICTGKLSNLIVVDIEEGGDPSFLPQETTIVKTGGNGWHYYYRFVEGVQNKARIKELVDIRGEGGYVVAPGSSSSKGKYELIKMKEPPMFPKYLFTKPGTATDSAPLPNKDKIEPTSAETESDGFFLVESYEGYGKGVRNDEMTRFIGKVLTRIHPAHWNTHGWQIIQKANEKNTPPLAKSELYASFNSIKGIETRKTPINASTVKNDPNSAVLSYISDGSDEVKHISVVAAEQAINQDDVYPLEMECFDELILGGASPGDVITIAGKTGEGKTSLSQDWTLSLIRGKKKAPVIWFSYEVLPSHLWKKFKTMGMTEEDVAVIPAKHTSGNVAWVEAKIKEAKEKFGVKAVVIDHLGFLLPKTSGILGKNMSQNHATFLTQIMRDLKTVALQEEIIIILPVHLRKTEHADIDAIKDSVGISQECDLVFLIERERDKDPNATSYYTEYTKITLAKNRKTGQTITAWFTMMKERFAYSDRNEVEKKTKEAFNSFEEAKSIVPDVVKSYAEDEKEVEVVISNKSLLDEF